MEGTIGYNILEAKMKLKFILILMIVLFGLALPLVSSYTQQEIYDNAIILWYPSVNLSNDNSSQKRSGTVAVGVTLDTVGQKVGSAAADFAGSTDAIQFNADAHMNSVINFTVCTVTTHTDEGSINNIITRHVGANSYDWYLVDVDLGEPDNFLAFRLLPSGGGDAYAKLQTPDPYYNSDDGYLVCVVANYTGGNAYAYLIINTTVVASASASDGGGTLSSTDPFVIGDDGDDNSQFFVGQMEDVYYINLSLSTDDISTHIYNGGNYKKLLAEVPDTTPPIVKTTFNITNPLTNSVINFTGNVTDETGLSYGNITYNISGIITKINFTLSGTSAQMSNVTSLTSVGVINFTMYATDSSGNVKQNSTLITVTDGIKPIINTTLNISTIKINNILNVTANVTDETGLSFCQFIENMTLSNGQKTYTNISISGTSAECSNKYTISLGRGNVINFTVIANDTSNNLRMNDTIITVADTLGSIAIGTNLTTIYVNNVINVSGNITEPDGNIAFCMVAHNQSGTMANTSYAGSGNNFNCSQSITITLTRSKVINFSVFYNDTYGTSAQASSKITVSDTLPTTPTSDSLTPNNPVITDTLTGSCSGSTDADGDSITYHYRFYDITDAAERQAFSATSTYALSSPTDAHDQFRVDCRATTAGGNSGDRTGTDLETVANTLPIEPTGDTLTPASPVITDTMTGGCTGSTDADGDSLTYYYRFYSITDTAYRGAGFTTGTTYALVSPTDSHDTLRVDCYTNDGTGNGNTRTGTTQRAVGNTVPTGITFIKPLANTLYNQQPLHINITWTADADGDAISTVSYWVNDTSKVNQTISLTGNTGNTTLNASDNTYNITASIYDGYGWSNNVSILSFKIDTVNPTDDLLTIIPNLTYIRVNTNFTIQSSDNNLEGHNITAFTGDDLSGAIKFSTEITGITSTTNDIKVEINTSWGDGRYTIVSNESDDHTAKKIGNYSVGKNEVQLTLEFNTTEKNNRITQKLKSSDIGLLDFYAYKSQDEKEYIMVWNFSNTTVTDALHTYTFKTNSKDDDLTYRNLSKYPSHFISKDNWIDYRLRTNYSAIYEIKEVQQGKFETTIITQETTLIFEGIGGVNFGSSRTQVEIDTGIPQFFNLNLSTTEIKPNNTFISANILNFTFNVSDKNNDTILFYVNGNKNITSAYISNQTKNATITFADGNFTILMEINDSAGNKLNSSFINVVVDTTVPVFANAYNRTADSNNNTNILTTTDVNISVSGFGDVYAYNGNFSYNISNGTWYNTSSFNLGNGTYHTIINKNNLTAGMVGGWKFYAYDLAGNELDPIYTFSVGSPAIPPAIIISSVSGGGGGTLDRCLPFADAFGVCYYHSGFTCVKGCPEGLVCGNDFRCIIGDISPAAKQEEQLQEFSFLQKLWLGAKNGFNSFLEFARIGLDSSSSLSIKQQETAVIKAEERTQITQKATEAMIQVPEQIKQHPYMALSIAGIVAIILAFIQFNVMIFMPPLIFYIIAYYFIVWVLWYFKVIN